MATGSGDMTTGEEAVYALLDLLNAEEIPYMLVGSFSSNAWGEARSTKGCRFRRRNAASETDSPVCRPPRAIPDRRPDQLRNHHRPHPADPESFARQEDNNRRLLSRHDLPRRVGPDVGMVAVDVGGDFLVPEA